MPLATQDNLLTLDAGLTHFKAVYMPARNYSKRAREEYESDLSDLIAFLTLRHLTAWHVVGLRDLTGGSGQGNQLDARLSLTPEAGRPLHRQEKR